MRREPVQHPLEVQGMLVCMGKCNVLALLYRAGRWESFVTATGLLLPAAQGWAPASSYTSFMRGLFCPPHIQHACNWQAGSGQQDLLCLPKPAYGSVLVYTIYATVSLETRLKAVSLAGLCAGDGNLDSTWLINRIKIYLLFPSVTMMKQVTIKTYCSVLIIEEIKKLN